MKAIRISLLSIVVIACTIVLFGNYNNETCIALFSLLYILAIWHQFSQIQHYVNIAKHGTKYTAIMKGFEVVTALWGIETLALRIRPQVTICVDGTDCCRDVLGFYRELPCKLNEEIMVIYFDKYSEVIIDTPLSKTNYIKHIVFANVCLAAFISICLAVAI